MPYYWICPECGYLIVAKSKEDAYEAVSGHLWKSHHIMLSPYYMVKKSIKGKRTINLGEYGVIKFIRDKDLYEMYQNPEDRKAIIAGLRAPRKIRKYLLSLD